MSQVLHSGRAIFRSKKHEALIQELGGKSSDDTSTPFPTLREALTFCAFLGFRENKRIKLSEADRGEDIASAQYDLKDAIDCMFLLGLAEERDSDILLEDREHQIVEIYEEYALGGLEIIDGWRRDFPQKTFVREVIEEGLKSVGITPERETSSITDVTF